MGKYYLIISLVIPHTVAEAGSASVGPVSYTNPIGVTYYGYARITTNSQVIGAATVKKVSGSADSGCLGANAHILNSADVVIASSGTSYNSGSTQGYGTSVSLSSPQVGSSYRALGTFRVSVTGSVYYSFSTSKTAFQTYYGTKSNSNDDNEIVSDGLHEWYELNSSGEYIGTITALDDLLKLGVELDLVEAMNREGIKGFIRLSEQGFYCGSTEEANQWMAARGEARFVNLYDRDGKTVIGQFELTPVRIEGKY